MKKGPVRSILGKTFSKLRVIEYAGVTPRGVHFWKCVCECGNYYTTTTTSLEHNHAKSCGCLRKQPRIQLGMLSFDGLVRQVTMSQKKKS